MGLRGSLSPLSDFGVLDAFLPQKHPGQNKWLALVYRFLFLSKHPVLPFHAERDGTPGVFERVLGLFMGQTAGIIVLYRHQDIPSVEFAIGRAAHKHLEHQTDILLRDIPFVRMHTNIKRSVTQGWKHTTRTPEIMFHGIDVRWKPELLQFVFHWHVIPPKTRKYEVMPGRQWLRWSEGLYNLHLHTSLM